MRVTRKDVAKEAGVSTATVSYVLNQPEKVSDETRERVLQVIRELDYHPDMIARSMSVKQTMQIGIVLEDIYNPFSGGVVRGFENAANDKNYFVSICTSVNKLDDYFDNFITRRIDGIYVAALPYKFKMDKLYNLVDHGIKVIVSGNVQADHRKISLIEHDYMDAMERAVAYLYGLGHRRIAYISGLGKNMMSDLRCAGYRQAIASHGLEAEGDLLVDGKYPFATGLDEGYVGAKRLFAAGRSCSAVLCTNDVMAIGAMKAIRECGLRIPEDVSVMGFDGIQMGEYIEPSLTTMGLDQQEFGRRAFEMLYTSIRQNTMGYYEDKLTLVERGSTGPCRE